ncbi:UNVERIFIED_CONTAM: hypothetical protein Slati_2944400 [Sesamum latifolium]|uniref:Uncharacterized protein n=1 Tax=Sesamum latifolium TaxID=2727402 RepID=A0AAW2VH85_9LAMI
MQNRTHQLGSSAGRVSSRRSTSDRWCVPRSNCDRTSYCYPDTDHASASCGRSYDRLPRHSTSSDTSTEETSPALLGAIQQIVSAATREQVEALAPARIATPSDVEALDEEPEEAVPVPAPPIIRRLDIPSMVPQEVPAHWLARLECLQKGLEDVQYQIGEPPGGETRDSLHGGGNGG